MKTVVIATGNRHKVEEFRQILEPAGIRVLAASDCGGMPEVEEDGQTFRENAAKKALATARTLHQTVLADDSGLEVAALGGAPGVHSARYAGEGGNDGRNLAKLLRNLEGIEDRRARFVCVLAVASPSGEVQFAEGEVCGRIAWQAQGQGGFGYDPAFIPEGYEQTFGQLPQEVKNSLSHRGRAIRQALEAGII